MLKNKDSVIFPPVFSFCCLFKPNVDLVFSELPGPFYLSPEWFKVDSFKKPNQCSTVSSV
ncbi:hypothetical protein I79_019103 [Cricetulus griseus]|uniref:Uncharacterized protein n=1 Tax=Cricetulus griseus TaxID=10029 RepID=G3I6H9_CRIGR|nr:hypothetical protein I79_019103 [Cricetulus griseus]